MSLWWAKCAVWRKILPKLRQNKENTGWERSSLRQTTSFKPLCVKLSYSAYPGAQETKKHQEKSQEVYISRMHGATPSGRIRTKLGEYVCLADVI